MDKIELQIKSKTLLTELAFTLKINGTIVQYNVVDDKIIIETETLFGLNKLVISVRTELYDDHVEIVDFLFNTVSSRQSLYLSYYENPETCSTWLTDQHPEIIIPFGNPMSWWLAECIKKIPNTYYGTNLYEKFDIFYPDSIDIDDYFPKLIKDFMKYSVGFHINDKSAGLAQNKNLPWIKINLDYDEKALFDEFANNLNLLDQNFFVPKQNQYVQHKSKDVKLWQAPVIFHNDKEEYSREDFPVVYELLDRIRNMNIEVIHSYVSILHPKSCVFPHADDFYKYDPLYKNTQGCSQFFIPIGWKSDNYFKFNDAGFLPFDAGAYLVNNSDFVHGSINASDTVRFTIGIYCRFTEENIQTLIAL